MSADPQIRNHVSFIWSVAGTLRGVYKPSEYGRVIPFVVPRRRDCMLEPTMLARNEALKGREKGMQGLEAVSALAESHPIAGAERSC